MPLTSNQTSSRIPVFVENQVLRAADLNSLAEELLRQMRQNRKFNIGVGPINGLEVNWLADDGIVQVTSGLAISSDGYTFELGECNFNYYVQRPFDDCQPLARECGNKYQRLLEMAGKGFELAEFDPATDALEIQEGLWQETQSDPFRALVAEGDYCLILLWCRSETRRLSCFNDCEARGIDQSMRMRAVLVPAEAYRKEFGFDPDDDPSDDGTVVNLPDNLQMCRFGVQGRGTTRKKIDLCRITNWQQLYSSYRTVCTDIFNFLVDAYFRAYREFYLPATNNPNPGEADVFKAEFENHLIELFNKVYPVESLGNCPDIQYLYSYHRELILAYRAFISVANGLVLNVSETTGPSVSGVGCLFPAHVSLGGLTEQSTCPTSPYIPPDSSEEKNEQVAIALRLFQRMLALSRKENVRLSTLSLPQSDEQLRLTPGVRREPFLRGRALPFYYHNGLTPAVWSAGLAAEGWTHQYHTTTNHPLIYRLEPYDFYRIEGHLGQELPTVMGQLEELRSCYNVAFDILAVRIEPDNSLEQKVFVAEDLEAWYGNTRSDILCKLAEFGPDRPDTVDLLIDWLNLHPTLGSISLQGPNLVQDGACCEFVPPTVNDSEVLLDFAQRYPEIVKYSQSTDQDVPRLDNQMGESIWESALAYHERRFQAELSTRFSCFAHAHPGLEHLGGVPKGGTLVLVYKEESDQGDFTNLAFRRRVVADFCLPYLCCSDQLVVRNEIREFKAEIQVPDDPYCWLTADNSQRPPIEVSVSPAGGTLQVLDSAGNVLAKLENVGNVVQVDPNGFSAEPTFVNGVGQLQFVYELAAGGTVNAILTVFRQPVLDCGLENQIRAAQHDENCILAGYSARLLFATPIDLSGITDLHLVYGPDGSDPLRVPIKELGAVVRAEWLNADGALAAVELPLSNNYDTAQLEALNGPCSQSCPIDLPSYCPTNAQYVQYGRYVIESPEEEVTPIPAGQTSVDIPIDPTQDTGFVSLLIRDTGMRLRTFRVVTDPLNPMQEFRLSLYKPSADPAACATDARYYLVYNRQAADEYLKSLSAAGIQPPFTALDLSGLEDLGFDGPTPLPLSIGLDYFANLEGCEQEEPLAQFLIKFTERDTPEDPSGGDDDVVIVTDTDPPVDIDSRESTGVSVERSASDASMRILNRRSAGYRNRLLALKEEDAGLARSTGFKRTNLFLDERDESKIAAAYTKALEATLDTRADTSEERQPLYATVATVLTHAYLDKIAIASDSAVAEALPQGLKDLKEAGIKPGTIKRGWKAGDLKEVMDADHIDELNAKIKA